MHIEFVPSNLDAVLIECRFERLLYQPSILDHFPGIFTPAAAAECRT